MKIRINDLETEIAEGLTISALLAERKVKMPEMVSVQLNGAIVEREAFPTTRVGENDTVEFMYFMGGGMRGGRWEVEGGRWTLAGGKGERV